MYFQELQSVIEACRKTKGFGTENIVCVSRIVN